MDVFSLAAKITLDTNEYESALGEASGKTHSFAETLKNGLANAAKVGAAAIGVASAAVGALTKQSLDGYAEYEQLVGGVETLFKESADIVTGYAENAYKTAGLSANQYMETVTSFSASLLQSLGGDTEAAADVADLAITDMADNANKMGTAMDSIQNAYQGFAKQNFTMLDNLKLGYGGTKEEMERLLTRANEINAELGISTDYQIDSYADIVAAIHLVQTEMGITGTTAAEASSTIQGSVSAAESAWENLVDGIGNENADLDVLITNFVDSVGTAGENIIPRVEQILVGIGASVQKLAPIIGEQLPPLIQSVLPSLLSAGGELIAGLAGGIIESAPSLIETGVPMIASLVSGLSAALPSVVSSATEIINTLVGAISEQLPSIASSAVEIVTSLADGISEQLPTLVPAAVDAVLQLAETLTDPDNLNNMVDSALELIMSLADGLIDALPNLIEKAPEIVGNLVDAIVENAPKLLGAALKMVAKLAAGIVENLPKIGEAAVKIVNKLIDGVGELWEDVKNVGMDIIRWVGDGVSDLIDNALQWGKDLIDNFVNGIKSGIQWVIDAVSGVADTVKSFLGFSEPEKGPLSNFHTYAPDMMQLFAQGITDNAGLIEDSFNKALDFKRNLDLGTAKVGFESSAVGVSTAAMANTAYTAAQSNGSMPITLNLMFPDGTKFASYYFDPMTEYASANGTPIINPKE